MKKEPLSDLADKYFDLISEDIKEKIIKYPIYTLYKELIILKANNSKKTSLLSLLVTTCVTI
ncbi:hypothetical protein B8V16_06640 [Streptococcus agalactiae]|nr:hypothetical protein B8V13_09160 [Streptococcus agalactiae]KAF1146045.1 hypothetical protein B8V16_06640 [Streptococcus agalactiae]KAF1165112.1 hypothetical protein B8V22_09605 [Streptococcus agalactiae]KAF1212840.1 hypothetical protein B8V45_09445 [Streptococcus agalactiae]KAF1260708.1 hypothetical protein B8V75_06410 [Streptococcus agalactiae]